MSNYLIKNRFSIPLRRLFTRPDHDAYDLIHFQEQEQWDNELVPALECPDGWSAEATALLASEAACKAIPIHCNAVEENTVPSWLWRRFGQTKRTTEETSVTQIFDRVTGAAVYAGWKQDLFADEAEARSFYDEMRYLLSQRFVALEPRILASLGLDWAYGLAKTPATDAKATAQPVEISNAAIDAIVSGTRDKSARAQWQRLLTSKAKAAPVALNFTDVAADWGAAPAGSMHAVVDAMAFRHNDGSVNIEALRHAVRLLVILFDLHNCGDAIAIGLANLTPLLMALALPYESEAARTTAAAITAIVTAEAYATSAELASLRGSLASFASERETIFRALRNHRRAAFGDRNDYEKMSVLPAPLVLEACPDLALAAAARESWDETLDLVGQHGLRHRHVTSFRLSPTLALFMESYTQGIQPMRTLNVPRAEGADTFQRDLHPSVTEALIRLHYNRPHVSAVTAYVAGLGTLAKAPMINHTALRAHGFDTEALQKVEDYLPLVNNIRLAFTPWILGEEFCRKALKIPADKLRQPRFDLLRHIGFSAEDIITANRYCYGHDTVKGSKDLRPQHSAIFACDSEISPEAHIRMAASVQSFVSDQVDLDLAIPVGMPPEKIEALLLDAWRRGLKGLTLIHDEDVLPLDTAKAKQREAAHIRPNAFLHAKAAPIPTRTSRPKAGARMVEMGHEKAPATKSGKRH